MVYLWTVPLDNASKQGAVNFPFELDIVMETLSSPSVNMCTKSRAFQFRLNQI